MGAPEAPLLWVGEHLLGRKSTALAERQLPEVCRAVLTNPESWGPSGGPALMLPILSGDRHHDWLHKPLQLWVVHPVWGGAGQSALRTGLSSVGGRNKNLQDWEDMALPEYC